MQLTRTDYGLARRVLQDLITNAWKAGANCILVAVRGDQDAPDGSSGGPADAASTASLPRRGMQWVTIQVDDDGPGIAPGAISDPESSLHVLENHLQRYSGTVLLTARAGCGTTACVRWRSVRW